MKKVSIQRFSMLGIILMGVSVVTAAVLPSNSKSSTNRFDQPGSLTASNDNCNLLSCTLTANISPSQLCNITAASGTTGVEDGSISNCTTVGDR